MFSIGPMLAAYKRHLMSIDGGMVHEYNADARNSRMSKISELVGGVDGLKDIAIMRKCFSEMQEKQRTKGGKKFTVGTVLAYIGTYRNFMKFAYLAQLPPFKECASIYVVTPCR